jgi:hypothetical protein
VWCPSQLPCHYFCLLAPSDLCSWLRTNPPLKSRTSLGSLHRDYYCCSTVTQVSILKQLSQSVKLLSRIILCHAWRSNPRTWCHVPFQYGRKPLESCGEYSAAERKIKAHETGWPQVTRFGSSCYPSDPRTWALVPSTHRIPRAAPPIHYSFGPRNITVEVFGAKITLATLTYFILWPQKRHATSTFLFLGRNLACETELFCLLCRQSNLSLHRVYLML